MCPFCWTTVAMMTAGVASTGALGAVLVRVGLARVGVVSEGRTQADMYERIGTNLSEGRSGDDNERD